MAKQWYLLHYELQEAYLGDMCAHSIQDCVTLAKSQD